MRPLRTPGGVDFSSSSSSLPSRFFLRPGRESGGRGRVRGGVVVGVVVVVVVVVVVLVATETPRGLVVVAAAFLGCDRGGGGRGQRLR